MRSQILLLLSVGAAMYALAHVGELSAGVATWLLAHDVLVLPTAAVFTLPGVHAGLDAPRLGLLAGVLVLLVVMAVRRRATARQQL